MKYYRLHIDSKNDSIIYRKITKILAIEPADFKEDKNNKDLNSLWTYSVEEKEEEPNYDFINQFLDIIEPNLSELKKIGIDREDITFWMIYEYDQQCSMEFHPQEMKRLGESGIIMCIDCFQK